TPHSRTTRCRSRRPAADTRAVRGRATIESGSEVYAWHRPINPAEEQPEQADLLASSQEALCREQAAQRERRRVQYPERPSREPAEGRTFAAAAGRVRWAAPRPYSGARSTVHAGPVQAQAARR